MKITSIREIEENKIKKVWVCNPYVVNGKWKNCSPIKAEIKDINDNNNFYNSYADFVKEIEEFKRKNQEVNVDYDYLLSCYCQGHFAILIGKSFYDGQNYCNITSIDLDYVFSSDFKETDYFTYEADNDMKNDMKLKSRRCLKKNIALFDNEKEAKEYTKICQVSGDEVKRLQGLIKKVDEEISNLVNKKKIFQEQLNKLISEKH